MTMTFKRESMGQYISRDGLFLILVNGSKWDVYLRDGNLFEIYATGFKSCKAAKEKVLNTFYSQHINL